MGCWWHGLRGLARVLARVKWMLRVGACEGAAITGDERGRFGSSVVRFLPIVHDDDELHHAQPVRS